MNDKQRKYYKETYNWLKEHHVCVWCRQEKTQNGKVTCESCRQKRKDKYKNLTEEERAKYISIQKTRYWARRNASVCIDCGEELAETSSFFCLKHLKMRRKRENRYRLKRAGA